MSKKRKIDFVLYEDNDEMLVFRFRPRQSSCHSFNETPPTKREEVYKVYYSYSIFKRWKDNNFVDMVFDCYCIIDEIAARIKHIINGEKSVIVNHMGKEYVIELFNSEKRPFGDGVSWTINECRKEGLYEIVLWNYNETGYRFYLEKDKFMEFGEYLNECCEYMLAHGDPI